MAVKNGTRMNDVGMWKLWGTSSDDTLDGGVGADEMEGGNGNDTYYVDNANDVVRESAGQGYKDTVFATVSYTLAAGVQVEYLQATHGNAAINLTGNEIDNFITGNDGANVLNGGGGVDQMYGGRNNDIYYVDTVLDFVFEASGQGTDRVRSSVSYALTEAMGYIEVLETTDAAGTASINLSANWLGNTVIGNNGSNEINGLGGPDTMEGRGGNDTYFVDNIGDVVLESVGGGFDRVRTTTTYVLTAGSEVEVLEVQANGIPGVNLTGNGFGQAIIGNNGSNIIDGLGGNDTLTGGGGPDTFVFNHLGAANQNQHDIIVDFVHGVDRIDLRGTGIQDFADLFSPGDRYMEDVGADVLIHTSVSGNTSVLLQNVQFSSLTASDFLFA